MTLFDVIGWLILLTGGMLALWDKRAGKRRRAPAHWDEAAARIVSARVVDAGDIRSASGEGEALWSADVRYAYSVSGVPFEGQQSRFFGRDATSLAEAERVAAAFPAGAVIEIAVDPSDPAHSAIAYDPPNRGLLGLGLVVAVIGLLVLMVRR